VGHFACAVFALFVLSMLALYKIAKYVTMCMYLHYVSVRKLWDYVVISGSGKTTLLDCLAGRKNSGTIAGRITFNGRKPKTSDYKRIVGYVEQFDTLVGELTVEQMLEYTAALKLPACTTPEERKERVNEVIARLDLEKCRHTVIGNALLRGISGGQAKRVNIGLALITRPRVLFLDEPTSGLDSRTADEVIDLLWQLARDGRTVACTIHSPTGAAFQRFDDLHMLHGGRTIYDGTLSEVQPYFEGLGYTKVPEMSLPEWLVDLTSDSPRQTEQIIVGPIDVDEVEVAGYGRNFVAMYEKSHVRRQSVFRRDSTMSVAVEETKDLSPPSQFSRLLTLLRFRMVAHYKNGEFLGTRFGDKIVFSILILSLYWGIGDNTDAQSIQSTAALLYFVAAICGYGAAAFVPSLTLERSLYYRELSDGCYAPATYYMAKFIEEGVLATITSLIFCLVVYFGCALQGNFFLLFVSYYLTTMMGIILAYAVAAISPTMEAANAILPTFVTIWMFFGGLFIVFDKIPRGWYWFSWTSFLRYSWGAMMLNQFEGEENGSLPVFYGENGEAQNILEFYGLEGDVMGSIGACLGLLSGLIGFFSLIGVVGLKFIRHDKR
jgi:ATP-binding cassette subfamily G (WHITE) protein 2